MSGFFATSPAERLPLAAVLRRSVEQIGIPPSLFTRSTALFLAILAGQAASFAVQAVVARNIGPASYGLYSYAFTLANLLALVAAWGGDRMLVRFVSDYHGRGCRALVRRVVLWTFSRIGTVALIAGAALAAMGWMAGKEDPERAAAFMLAGLCVPIIVGGNLAENVLRALGAQSWANLPNRLIRPILMGLVFLLLLQAGSDRQGAMAAVGSNAVAIALTAAAGLLASWIRLGPAGTERLPADPQWRKVGIALGLGTLALYLTQQVDVLLLGYLTDASSLGVYTAVTRIASVLAFANIAAVATIQPVLARRSGQQDSASLQSVLRGGARFAFFVNLAAGLPVLVLAEPILRVFGGEFVTGAFALRVLTLATMIASSFSMSGAALSMRGCERHATAVLIAGCLLALVSNLLLIPYAGIDGAALATGASTVAWNIGLFLVAQRKLGVLALPFGRTPPPLSAAVVAARDVTIFLPTLAGGGAERAMLNLARGFAEAGHPTTLVVVHDEGAYRDLVPAGVRKVVLGSTRTWQAALQLARYLRRERPWRVYSAMDDANLVALTARFLALSPSEIVCGIHNTPSLRIGRNEGWRGVMRIRLLRWLYRTARAVVAVSDGVAADSQRVFALDAGKLVVIPNPVLVPELQVRADEPAAHPWLVGRKAPVLLACGRLTAQKDYPTLLRAMERVRRARDVRLIILGEGEQRAELEALRDELGLRAVVDMPGFAANPYAYMAACDLFVLSSRYEGSPVVLVEALACGARIVSTDCPSGPAETLADVPGTKLVPVGAAGALADAILGMVADRENRPGPRCLERFDYRAAAQHYLDLHP
ncbi:MAG TPA: glycosyltransferase [Geminicoccus sp.]|jgi:O-antigen/teichoic acid export membrane protein|uniref:glycosyltransferase n=1 Tax=Geminicoccus sp. TaxID=2024832 RepID=UPI002E304045|nr:glycosyltransferase [Geminicoccus sp.]HEX2526681.1 glycosyltransferase [Geminicoccus sp.]